MLSLIPFLILSTLTKSTQVNPQGSPLDALTLPAGYNISVYQYTDLARPRQLAVIKIATSTIVFVSSRTKILRALIDTDSNGINDKVLTVYESNNHTVGSVAVDKNGNLYIGAVKNIHYCPNASQQVLTFTGTQRLTCSVFYTYSDRDSSRVLHSQRHLQFNGVGDLCVANGAHCDLCACENSNWCTINCFGGNNASNVYTIAKGVRNSFGFDVNPLTNEIWFTDSGADFGPDKPDDELNVITKNGTNDFGFPYCHTLGVGSPYNRTAGVIDVMNYTNISGGNGCDANVVRPVQALGPHVVSLGMSFVRPMNPMFSPQYDNTIFIAERGSFGRNPKIGYRIALVKLGNANATKQSDIRVLKHDVFVDGFLNNKTQVSWGRPVDVTWLPDGSMLISDDTANAIYRVAYREPVVPSPGFTWARVLGLTTTTTTTTMAPNKTTMSPNGTTTTRSASSSGTSGRSHDAGLIIGITVSVVGIVTIIGLAWYLNKKGDSESELLYVSNDEPEDKGSTKGGAVEIR